tara:strand:+ start:2006 stop:2188 length:183 start_codon:yes stop_codon:yes gene_type:complete
MFEAWLMGNNWTQEQWLIVSIIGFVIVASLVVAYRLYTIFKMSTKKRERPNLRAGRRLRR